MPTTRRKGCLARLIGRGGHFQLFCDLLELSHDQEDYVSIGEYRINEYECYYGGKRTTVLVRSEVENAFSLMTFSSSDWSMRKTVLKRRVPRQLRELPAWNKPTIIVSPANYWRLPQAKPA